MKEKVRKEYLRITRKEVETKALYTHDDLNNNKNNNNNNININNTCGLCHFLYEQVYFFSTFSLC